MPGLPAKAEGVEIECVYGTLLRLVDQTTLPDRFNGTGGTCHGHHEQFEQWRLPEDFELEVRGEAYTLPDDFSVGVCPTCYKRQTGEQIEEATETNLKRLLRQHWDVTGEFFVRSEPMSIEARIAELEERVAQLEEASSTDGGA